MAARYMRFCCRRAWYLQGEGERQSVREIGGENGIDNGGGGRKEHAEEGDGRLCALRCPKTDTRDTASLALFPSL